MELSSYIFGWVNILIFEYEIREERGIGDVLAYKVLIWVGRNNLFELFLKYPVWSLCK
jgi:hypothetical protein